MPVRQREAAPVVQQRHTLPHRRLRPSAGQIQHISLGEGQAARHPTARARAALQVRHVLPKGPLRARPQMH